MDERTRIVLTEILQMLSGVKGVDKKRVGRAWDRLYQPEPQAPYPSRPLRDWEPS